MRYLLFSVLLLVCGACSTGVRTDSGGTRARTQVEGLERIRWGEVDSPDGSAPTPRHEAAFVRVGTRAYLLGGRGIKPVDIYDLSSKTWSRGAPSPIEIHHFQPVVYNEEIYLMGAMTGPYPGELPLPEVYIYSPAKDAWRTGGELPPDRLRGGAGTVLVDDKIYLVCGITDGHRGGHVPWLDVYTPQTGRWERLPDAPRPRDHFQTVHHDGKLYAAAGRTTVAATNPFANTISEVDVYDIASRTWTTLPAGLPTARAGNAATVEGGHVLILGGESTVHEVAHDEVEALDTETGTWTALRPLSRGRHGTGVVHWAGGLLMASGCGNRGGSPELDDVIGTR